MSIAARQILAVDGGASLPYDSEVEYIEGTITQWIDTGVDYWCDFEITCRTESSNNSVYLIGNAARSSLSAISSTQYHFGNTNRSFKRITANVYDEWHTLKWKDDEIRIDGVLKATFQKDETITGRVYVFGYSGSYGYPARVSALKLWDTEGNLIHDSYSVRVGNAGYLYDRVSGSLFGSATSDAFVAGPDGVPMTGGGYEPQCIKTSHRRSAPPSARFWRHSQEWEVAA